MEVSHGGDCLIAGHSVIQLVTDLEELEVDGAGSFAFELSAWMQRKGLLGRGEGDGCDLVLVWRDHVFSKYK